MNYRGESLDSSDEESKDEGHDGRGDIFFEKIGHFLKFFFLLNFRS